MNPASAIAPRTRSASELGSGNVTKVWNPRSVCGCVSTHAKPLLKISDRCQDSPPAYPAISDPPQRIGADDDDNTIASPSPANTETGCCDRSSMTKLCAVLSKVKLPPASAAASLSTGCCEIEMGRISQFSTALPV